MSNKNKIRNKEHAEQVHALYSNIFLRILLLAMIIFILYQLMILIYGNAGLLAIKKLDHYSEQLSENIVEIKTINQDLNREMKRVKGDAYIITEARELGYYNEGDLLILLEGRVPNVPLFSPGKSTPPLVTTPRDMFLIRLVTVAMGIILLIIFLLYTTDEMSKVHFKTDK